AGRVAVQPFPAEGFMTKESAPRRSFVADLGLSLALAVAYFLLARLSMLFSAERANLSFVWLPAGLALGAILLGGPGLILGILLGAFAADYAASGTLITPLIASLGSTLSALLAAWLLDRRFSFSPTLEQPRDLLTLIGIGAFATPMIAATLGTTVTNWPLQTQWIDWLGAWAIWWAGDALGVLLITPLLLAWTAQPGRQPPRPSVLALAALQLTVGVCVFTLHTTAGVYIYLALAVVGAMHIPLASVVLVNLLTFGAAALSALLGGGPFAGASLRDTLLILQT